MGAIRDWAIDFDLGEFLGVGLDTRQIGCLGLALFLGLLGLSAIRRVPRAGGPWPAAWIATAIGLVLGGALVAARGLPDQVPDELRPWTGTDRLLRAGAVLCLLGWSLVFLSAYWLRRPVPRLISRVVGLSSAGAAVWLAAGWFGDQLPGEVRPWAARDIVTRGLTVLGLLMVASACWFRPPEEAPHKRWSNRVLAAPAGGAAVLFAVQWFGPEVWPELPVELVGRAAATLTAVGTGTCALVAAGAFLLRERPRRPRDRRSGPGSQAALPPLPVAVLLDDQGRPVLPYPNSDRG